MPSKVRILPPPFAGDAGVAQLVERKPSKLDVAGSSPVSRLLRMQELELMSGTKTRETRSERSRAEARRHLIGQSYACDCVAIARVAQSVERTLGKGEVIGSIPIASLDVGHLTLDAN
jgi:hypothetical protein